MSFISSAVYFGETSVAFGGYSTVQMELTVELWVRVLQTPKANSCISEWFSKPLSCHEFRVCKGREGPVFLQRASQFSIFFGEPLNQPTNPHCPLFVCYTNTNPEFFANFNFSMPQLPSGLGCCESAKIPRKAQGSASFSPKSEWLWEVLPHKGLFEAVGTSWQGCLCLQTDGQAFYFSEQSRVEKWSQNPASVSRDRASLGQEGSDVCALQSSRAKWWTVDRTAIIWSVRSPTLPTFHSSLAELMPYLLVSQNPFWHKYKPSPGGKQLSGSKMPRFVLTAPSTQSESGCHSWPLAA